MFELFKKLLMAQQIKFEEGNITFLNSRVLFAPSEIFVNLIHKFKDDEKMCLEFYKASKFSLIEDFGEKVSKMYNIKQMELAKWLTNSANIGGWGRMKFVAEDDFNKMFVIKVINGISKKIEADIPVDHFLRGQIAGGASAAFKNIDFDCIERKCIACGDNCCEFVVKPREDFIKGGVSKKFAKQIFSKDEIITLKINLLK